MSISFRCASFCVKIVEGFFEVVPPMAVRMAKDSDVDGSVN